MATSLFSDKKFLFFTIAWWLLVMMLHFWILIQDNVDYFHATTDAVSSAVLLALLCFLLSNNMRYYLPGKEKYWFILISGLVVCLVWLILLLMTFNLIFSPGDPYISFLKQSAGVRAGAGFLLTSSLTMFSMLLYSQQEQKENLERRAEAEKLAKEAELFKLRQQLQPHFLFNSLNSINSLIGSHPEKARTMVLQLSDFLRGMLRKDEMKTIPFDEELQYIRLYLEIEKVRFGHRLQTEISCTDEALSATVPPLILQPVVENAIKFGLYDTTDEVLIKLTSTLSGKLLKIIIQNPFDPEMSYPAKGTGFGITSIRRRLFLIFSRTDLVQTRTEKNVYFTEILIPQS